MDRSLFDSNLLDFSNGFNYENRRDSFNVLSLSTLDKDNSTGEDRRGSISTFFESSVMPNGFRRFSFGFPTEQTDSIDLHKAAEIGDSMENNVETGALEMNELAQSTDNSESIFRAISASLESPTVMAETHDNNMLTKTTESLINSQSTLTRPQTPNLVGKASVRISKTRSKSPYTYPGSPFSALVPGVQRNGAYHSSGMNTPTAASMRNIPPRPSSTPAMLNFNQHFDSSYQQNSSSAYHLPSPAMSSPRDALTAALGNGMNLNATSPTKASNTFQMSPNRGNLVAQTSPLSRQTMPSPPMSSGELANVAIMLSSMPFGSSNDMSHLMSANGFDINGLSDSKVYHCPKPGCTKMYRNLNGLKYHMRQGRCDMDLNECDIVTLENTIAEKPYWCRSVGCRKKFKNLNGLKYHIRTQHPNEDVIALTRNCRVTLSSNNKRMDASHMEYAMSEVHSPILDFA